MSWAISGLSWACLGPVLGLSWACLGSVLGHLGAVLGCLGPDGSCLGLSWGCLGSRKALNPKRLKKHFMSSGLGGHFGPVLGHLGPVLGFSWAISACLGLSCRICRILTATWPSWRTGKLRIALGLPSLQGSFETQEIDLEEEMHQLGRVWDWSSKNSVMAPDRNWPNSNGSVSFRHPRDMSMGKTVVLLFCDGDNCLVCASPCGSGRLWLRRLWAVLVRIWAVLGWPWVPLGWL